MFQLKATQEVDLELAGVTDKKGNPTSVDSPMWSSSDDTVAVLTEMEGTTTTVRAGSMGTATVTLTADADLGEGVRGIEGTLEIEVVAGDAAIVNLTPSEPREQS